MKIVLAMTILWMAIAVEIAWSQSLPQGALLLPIACGIMFWMGSGTGILLSATALLIDWIARPGFLPLCPMLLPAIAVCLISPASNSKDYRSHRQSFLKLMTPLHLPLFTLLAVALQLIGQMNLSVIPTLTEFDSAVQTSLPSLLMISLPISAGISMLIRLADEFGLRRVQL